MRHDRRQRQRPAVRVNTTKLTLHGHPLILRLCRNLDAHYQPVPGGLTPIQPPAGAEPSAR